MIILFKVYGCLTAIGCFAAGGLYEIDEILNFLNGLFIQAITDVVSCNGSFYDVRFFQFGEVFGDGGLCQWQDFYDVATDA
jgi:hypothetical protein